MKNHELLDLIGDVNEDYVQAADGKVLRPNFLWKAVAACAACAVLVLGAYPAYQAAHPPLHSYTVLEDATGPQAQGATLRPGEAAGCRFSDSPKNEPLTPTPDPPTPEITPSPAPQTTPSHLPATSPTAPSPSTENPPPPPFLLQCHQLSVFQLLHFLSLAVLELAL